MTMDPATITTIIGIILQAIQAAVDAGKSLRSALADSLREAADKIESGALNVDDAVARAKTDQAKIDRLHRRR
jgi:hypothetical protein